MAEESEVILALKPVSFCYDQEIDEDGLPQFGLVAEDVEKVNADLVLRNEEGKPYTVRYEAVNAMLLNEFLKEHRKVEDQERLRRVSQIAQQKEIEALTATVKEQAAQIQKVSAQLEASKPAPQVVEQSLERRPQQSRMKLGCVSAIDSNGRTIWIADAHRDDGKRFVVCADELLTAFVELESATRACDELVLTSGADLLQTRRR